MRTAYDDYADMHAVLTEPVSRERDHVIGPDGAPVTLVEYGDYECPFCAQAHPIVAAVRAALGDQLRFAYRHFPLVNVHPHAQRAAEAAEAAGSQGLFWEMHDALFAHQHALDDASLVRYALAIGADEVEFVRELAAQVHLPRVRADFLSGVRSGVNGTPTFFVNGVRHDGPFDLPSLLGAVEFATATR